MHNSTLDELYQQHPWRSINRFMPYAISQGFNKSDVKNYFKQHVFNDKLKSYNKELQLPIFSRVIGGYQFDTLIQSKNASIPAFLIFININSRKGYAYPMKNKSKSEVLRVLQEFINEVKPKSLSSDQDSAYLSNEVIDLMIKNNIDYRTTEDNDHNKLGIINRFIRTLRDYNNERDFTELSMSNCINDYNNTIHSSTGVAPAKFTINDEHKYINKMIELTDNIMSNNKYKLDKGDKVRVVLDKNIINKKRSNLSKECYIVDSSNGRAYNIVAKDNSVATYPRYKLIPTTKGVIADTIDNEKRGIIDKILYYDEHSDKYTVIYEGGVKDKIKSKYLRETTPTRLSNIELDFWKKQGIIPNALRKFYNN